MAEQIRGKGTRRSYVILIALAAITVAALVKGPDLVIFWAATQVALWAFNNTQKK